MRLTSVTVAYRPKALHQKAVLPHKEPGRVMIVKPCGRHAHERFSSASAPLNCICSLGRPCSVQSSAHTTATDKVWILEIARHRNRPCSAFYGGQEIALTPPLHLVDVAGGAVALNVEAHACVVAAVVAERQSVAQDAQMVATQKTHHWVSSGRHPLLNSPCRHHLPGSCT